MDSLEKRVQGGIALYIDASYWKEFLLDMQSLWYVGE